MATTTDQWLASLWPQMQALGQEKRWRIMCAARTPASREELKAAVPNIAEPTFAFHVQRLRALGLLLRRQEGREAVYTVDAKAVCDVALGVLSLQDRDFKLNMAGKGSRK